MVCTDVKRRLAVARPCTVICKILAGTWSLNRPPIGKKQHLYWTDWLQRRWTSRLMAPWCSFCHQCIGCWWGVNAILISGIWVIPIDYGIAIVYNRPFLCHYGHKYALHTIIFMPTTIKNSPLWGSFLCQLPSKMAQNDLQTTHFDPHFHVIYHQKWAKNDQK